MAKVRLLNGKPLMVGGKVALSDDCCCGTPHTLCCDGFGKITITFVGIVNCPAYGILDDMNGPFCLTRTAPNSHIFSGPGNDFTDGSGLRHTEIDVVCVDSDPDQTFSIAYFAPEGFSASFFLVVPESPVPDPLTDVPNGQTNCDDFQATGGTATITCGCA